MAASGFCPAASSVVTFVPLESPEFLESNLACREIAKDGILESAMPVYTDTLHFLDVYRASNVGSAFSRRIGITWPGIDPPHAGKHGNVVSASYVGCAPVVRCRAAPPHGIQSGRDITHPAVRAVAANVIIIATISACLSSVVCPVADSAVGIDGFSGLRAATDLLLDRVEFSHRAEPPAAAALARS